MRTSRDRVQILIKDWVIIQRSFESRPSPDVIEFVTATSVWGGSEPEKFKEQVKTEVRAKTKSRFGRVCQNQLGLSGFTDASRLSQDWVQLKCSGNQISTSQTTTEVFPGLGLDLDRWSRPGTSSWIWLSVDFFCYLDLNHVDWSGSPSARPRTFWTVESQLSARLCIKAILMNTSITTSPQPQTHSVCRNVRKNIFLFLPFCFLYHAFTFLKSSDLRPVCATNRLKDGDWFPVKTKRMSLTTSTLFYVFISDSSLRANVSFYLWQKCTKSDCPSELCPLQLLLFIFYWR